MGLEETVVAIGYGLLVIIGGSIAYNLWAMAQERKDRRDK